ncbi:MAG: hypothetical protein NTW53_06670 [Burkholderiales bacterium]|nr:hypothetical protein [Burkholderiales bacterium]
MLITGITFVRLQPMSVVSPIRARFTIALMITRSGSWRSIHARPENITAGSMMMACAGWLRPSPKTAANRRFEIISLSKVSRLRL